MAITEFSAALNQVATERGIPVESVLESIRVALAAAYRRDYGSDVEDIVVDIDSDTGEAKIFREEKDITPPGFGRIAAQTAKQVILQKIRETEKEVILDDFRSKVGSIISGHVFRVDNGVVILDLGRAQGVLPQSEQVETEDYRLNQRLKVLIKSIRETPRGTEIIVSRSAPDFIKMLFAQEVPEIASGTVTIEALAREAGSRTKMAVSSKDEKIDPVGSCVGQKGVRVQAIISEIFGEKIDIVPFSPNIEKFIAASLSPAKVTEVEVDIENKEAKVTVPEDQLSLAIGKDGQNVRLAAKLTKWRIDIKGAPSLFGDVEDLDKKEEDAQLKGIWDATIKASKKEKAKEEETKTVEEESDDTAAVGEEKGDEKVDADEVSSDEEKSAVESAEDSSE